MIRVFLFTTFFYINRLAFSVVTQNIGESVTLSPSWNILGSTYIYFNTH